MAEPRAVLRVRPGTEFLVERRLRDWGTSVYCPRVAVSIKRRNGPEYQRVFPILNSYICSDITIHPQCGVRPRFIMRGDSPALLTDAEFERLVALEQQLASASRVEPSIIRFSPGDRVVCAGDGPMAGQIGRVTGLNRRFVLVRFRDWPIEVSVPGNQLRQFVT